MHYEEAFCCRCSAGGDYTQEIMYTYGNTCVSMAHGIDCVTMHT